MSPGGHGVGSWLGRLKRNSLAEDEHWSASNVRYYWGDHLGSTRVVTDDSGNVCYDADYYPFQGERAYVTTCAPAYRFAGMKFDQESSDYYTLNRYYPPNLGRWLTPDPVAGDILNPQSLNRYAYVLNNPTNFIDPLGLLEYHPPLVPLPVELPLWTKAAAYSCLFDPFGFECQALTGRRTHVGGGGGFRGTTVDDAGAPIAPGRPCSVTPESIDQYLASKDSPLEGEGEDFFHEGARFNVDPRFTVAIAGAESSFGKNTNATWGLYNAWGWTGGNSWTNWATGIFTVSRGLGGRHYLGIGVRTTTSAIYYGAYCNPNDPKSNCGAGLTNINSFLKEQGGITNKLGFPCE